MSHPPSLAQRRLAARLRRLREDAGLSTYQLAKAFTPQWSQSRVTRVERAVIMATAADVEAWADATRAPRHVRDELSDLAYEAWTQSRSWRSSHRRGLAARQREMSVMERSATRVRHFQPALIPGLLQCPSYARRVLAMGNVTGQRDVDEAVAARAARQAVLREPGRSFEYVLTEGALRWRPGPRDLMAAQRDHLLTAARLPSVSVTVIPFDQEARTVYEHGFAIFDIPDAPLVLVEQYGGEDEKQDAREVALYEGVFAVLRESALAGEAALEFIRSVTG
jgi:transcriptional regulator with XRE-family HTH domain